MTLVNLTQFCVHVSGESVKIFAVEFEMSSLFMLYLKI